MVDTELPTDEELLEDTEALEIELTEVLGLDEATTELEVEDEVLLVVSPVLVVLCEDARYTPATATMTMITIIATTATVLAIAPDFTFNVLLFIKGKDSKKGLVPEAYLWHLLGWPGLE